MKQKPCRKWREAIKFLKSKWWIAVVVIVGMAVGVVVYCLCRPLFG